jgi:hypothetical protein
VPTVARVGVRGSLSAAAPSTDTSWSDIVTTDSSGAEISREWLEAPPPAMVIDVIQFAELDTGERVTVGDMILEGSFGDRSELEDDLRSFAIEDPEMVEAERELEGDGYEAPLQYLVDALAERGIASDAETLAALPLVVEVDDAVLAKLGPATHPL